MGCKGCKGVMIVILYVSINFAYLSLGVLLVTFGECLSACLASFKAADVNRSGLSGTVLIHSKLIH